MTDMVLLNTGMDILIKNLGLVEAERFVFLMNQEPFDYTQWQETLYKGMTAREISAMASERQAQKAKLVKF
jgi:PHD/YefM family antitoxin component YafN of YafNO toxin-antitoxin module